LVDWNDVLTECTGSNTAPYLLGAGQGSVAAMYYIVKYFKKEAGELNSALVVMLDAKKHLEQYGSKADNAGTPEREGWRWMERTLNKCDTELSLTQATSLLLGHKSSSRSELLWYVDNWDALTEARDCVAIVTVALNPHIEAKDHVEQVEARHDPEAIDVDLQDPSDVFHGDSEHKEDGGEEEFNLSDFPASCRLYMVDGKPVPVSMAQHYRNRGNALAAMNYVIYCLTMHIEIMTPEQRACVQVDSGDARKELRGRNPTQVYAFADTHPLYNR
jgi:hypothetical protein